MDLLATVRKEGSRGGRGEFKWSDVQSSSHRENYLGHSVMAPVGRWQKGRDLNWYAKAEAGADDTDAAERAAMQRKEELRKVKEAEEDAMARALGLPVPDRNNANLEEISDKRDLNKTLNDALGEADDTGGRGVGFDGTRNNKHSSHVLGERIEGNAEAQDKELQYALKEYKRRHGRSDRRRRSRSNDRHRESRRDDRARERRGDEKHQRSSHAQERHRRRRSRSRSRSRTRSRSRSRSRDRERRQRRRDRSRSPRRHRNDRSERQRRRD